MSARFPTYAVRLPSFCGLWMMWVRSWRGLRTCTRKKREADDSSQRSLSQRHPSTRPSARGSYPALRVSSNGTPHNMDTPLAVTEKPQPGSHVISPRRGYMHHGIYVGDGRVVHYAGLARGSFRGRIEEVPLAEFAYGRSVWTRSSGLPRFLPQEVIGRARSRLGENRYRVLRNNCEHFCEWCLRGEPRSYQVERFFIWCATLAKIITSCFASLESSSGGTSSAT